MCMIHESQFAVLISEFQAIVDFMEQCLEQGKRIDEVERGLDEKLRGVGLNSIKAYAMAAGDGDCGAILEHGGRRLKRSKERHVKKYHSIFGRFEIERFVYFSRDKQVIEYVPTDEKLRLPKEEQSFVLEDWSQRLTTNLPYNEAKQILQDLLGINISVRALESINGRMAEFVLPYWESAPPPTEVTEEELLVIAADGKGVPMRKSQEDRLEEELGKKKVVRAPKTDYEKSDKRRGRGGRKSRKQMAYLGVVYTVDPFVRTPQDILDEMQRRERCDDRPVPTNKRFRAEMNDIVGDEISYGQPRLFDWLAKEVEARDPDTKKTVVCLMDGQKSLWYWKRQCIDRAIGILDIFHVLERLWKAAHCFHKESSVEAEKFVEKYLRMMLEGNTGCVVGVFRRFAKKLSATKKKNLEAVIQFFDNNKQYMKYGEYIRAGYPIGSGVIEGGCRHVVRDRMELSGMRWNVAGAQSMLRLRTTKIANEWKPFVSFRIQAEINQRYATVA